MANLERQNSDVPAVPAPASFSAADTTTEMALRRAIESLRKTVAALSERINGLLSLGTPTNGQWSGNLDGQWIKGLIFKGTDELAVPHGLKRVPVVVLPVITSDMTDAVDSVIYASPTTAWTQDMVFLRKTGAGDRKVTVLVL